MKTELTAADLALYFGCEVEWLGERCSFVFGVNATDKSFNPIRLVNSDGHTIWVLEKTIKPILRPLSDMTEDENENAQKIVDAGGWGYEAAIAAELTVYLLSIGIDLFGWIDAGLAIDKTKLETK